MANSKRCNHYKQLFPVAKLVAYAQGCYKKYVIERFNIGYMLYADGEIEIKIAH